MKTKVFARAFYKKLVVSRGEAFGRLPQKAELFIRESAFSGVWTPFASEKGSMSRFLAEGNLEKFPVGSFRKYQIESGHNIALGFEAKW